MGQETPALGCLLSAQDSKGLGEMGQEGMEEAGSLLRLREGRRRLSSNRLGAMQGRERLLWGGSPNTVVESNLQP